LSEATHSSGSAGRLSPSGLAAPVAIRSASVWSDLRAKLAQWPALWLAVLTFAIYSYPSLAVVRLNSDAVEYIDIARRLVDGQGYLLGVRAYFISGSDVVHLGLDERSPVFPVLMAALFRIGLGLQAVQLVNSLFAAICVALIYGIVASLFDRRVALLAGLLTALNPTLLTHLPPPMSEAVTALLVLTGIWLGVRDGAAPGRSSLFWAGVAFGLAYLARPGTLGATAGFVAGLLFVAWKRGSGYKPFVSLLAGLALLVVPTTGYSLVARDSLTYSGQYYLYTLLDDNDVADPSYRQTRQSPLQFILANREAVAAATWKSLQNYASKLFLDPGWLLVFLPVWPIVLFDLLRGRMPLRAVPVLLVVGTNFLIYGLTWAAFHPRYQTMTLYLLLALAAYGLYRLGLQRLRLPFAPAVSALTAAVVAIVLVWLPTFIQAYRGQFWFGDTLVESRVDYGFRWSGPLNWTQNRDSIRIADWIDANTDRDAVVAQRLPWLSTFFTGRPTVALPPRASADELRAFLVEFRVSYVLLLSDDHRRRYQTPLQRLAGEGVQPLTVAGAPAFDTRSLWR
jgi:4-amino-4-deoxy-L-arabinose transferase-like glycosyltransferase